MKQYKKKIRIFACNNKKNEIMENLVLSKSKLQSIKKTLIEGLTVASGSRSSATYYHSKDDQVNAIKSQIRSMYKESKELPLIIASQKGVTGKFASEVLLNDFKQTYKGGGCNIVNPIDWYDNGLYEKAVLNVLKNLSDDNGLPYVLRLFIELKNDKVNNERSRKIFLGYLWGQSNLEFYAMKYRNKIANILKHIYGEKKTSILIKIAHKVTVTFFITEKESQILNDSILKYFSGDINKAMKLFLFIFKEDRGVDYDENDFPLISQYIIAKTDITKIKHVPEEVLLGLISNKSHPQYHNMWSTESQRKKTMALIRKNVTVTSVNQQVRQTKSTKKLGVDKVVNMSKATDFMALYKTGYETGFTPKIYEGINNLVEKVKIEGFYYKNIGIVVDESASMKGHNQESKNTPRAIADFTTKVLCKSAEYSKVFATDGFSTDLASTFIKLIKSEDRNHQYDAIFIITDGYENSYDGLTNEVISIYKAESGRDFPIFQISPITGAEMDGNVRNLGKDVVSMAINNPIAIQTQINSRLLEIDTKRWLENQLNKLTVKSLVRSKKLNTNI